MNTARRTTAIRTVAGLALAISSAVMLTLAFPPYGFWPLIRVGFVPMWSVQS